MIILLNEKADRFRSALFACAAITISSTGSTAWFRKHQAPQASEATSIFWFHKKRTGFGPHCFR